MEKFLGSERNKKMMQRFFCEALKSLAIEKKDPIIMSGVVGNDVPLPAQYVDVELSSSRLNTRYRRSRLENHTTYKMEPQAKSKHGEFYGGIQRY